jgi:hypothetical protein
MQAALSRRAFARGVYEMGPVRNSWIQSTTRDGRLSVAQVALAWIRRLTLTHHSQPPHCTMGMKWLQSPVNCRPLVTRLKWTADSKPNLQPETAPGQVEKN